MTITDRTRVLIVDDHQVVRTGLRTFVAIHDDLETVGEAANGAEAVTACRELQPHVVLMDLKMPVMDGPTATRAIREQFEHIQVVVLTSFDDESLVSLAIDAGAISYLFKDANEEQLVAAIRLAREGRSVLAPEALQALTRVATQKPDDTYRASLTQRETQVLRLLAHGFTNPQIASRLDISVSTVNFHVHNILDKLGAKTRTEAASIAGREGLLDS